MLGREAEVSVTAKGSSAHLSVEPFERVGPEAVGPAQAGTQMADAELAQPAHRVVEPVVLEMEPLADAEMRRTASRNDGRVVS